MMTKKRKPNILVIGSCERPISDAGGESTSASPYGAHSVAKLAAEADGLLLTGGGDVSPGLYGQETHRRAYGHNTERDRVELEALRVALERNIPIMGICRGAQMINVACGGTLEQHIFDLPTTHDFHQGHDHRVITESGSRLAQAVGGEDGELWVISVHHQAVKDLAPGFTMTAMAHDGTVEALEWEAEDRWIVGVQFHPEMAAGAGQKMQRLFNDFVAQAAKQAGLVKPKVRQQVATPMRQDFSTIGVPKQPTNYQRSMSGVTRRWRCFRCGIDFDERVDHLDHMAVLHGVYLPGSTRSRA